MISTALILAFVGLGSLVSLFVLWPLLPRANALGIKSRSHLPLARYETLVYERERILENLMELDVDFQFEKINLADHQDLKAALMEEASNIYSEIKALEGADPLLQAIENDLRRSV